MIRRLTLCAVLLLGAAPAVAGPAPAQAHLEFGGPSLLGAPAFWVFMVLAVGAVAGALVTITRRNAVSAVVGLVGTFVALAGVYVLLFAHFLAVIQVLIYAGAIMVLFIFVIMILGREETEPWALRALATKALGVGAVCFTAYVLWRIVRGPVPASPEPTADFGTVEKFGDLLFREYLFPFEAVSILLLLAVVGAIVIARGRPSAPAEVPPPPPPGEAAPPPEAAR